ncbi:HAD-IA family hydrolase [Acetobacterium paludosum]|uniref:HAD-IA family hydrolase n=1 Tax=Acetobacterium paludosum TaxID=52693 RepID=A0A923KS75_9FIRM|nr:HAD family phosphatase [Acetobacterium paludosum]MBC3888067.1 HAD-IA family hydrolase [Acetobacterium paludosum]
MNQKGIIFDMDGTLIDSMPVWKNLGGNFLKNHGINPPDNLNEITTTMSFAESSRYFVNQFGLALTAAEVNAEINEMIRDSYGTHLPLKPFVKEVLDQYVRQGIKMSILTATDRSLVETAVKRLGILDYFEFILTSDMTGLSKSEPEIYFQAVETFGIPEKEIAIVEDSLYCIKAAKNTECYIVGVYDEFSKNDWEEIKRVSDRTINSFEELRK